MMQITFDPVSRLGVNLLQIMQLVFRLQLMIICLSNDKIRQLSDNLLIYYIDISPVNSNFVDLVIHRPVTTHYMCGF